MRVAPSCSPAARRYKPPSPPPRHVDPPRGYAWMVSRVGQGLQERNPEMPVFSMPEPGRIAAYCPACRIGVLAIQFLDNPPRYRIESPRGDDVCSDGCSSARIEEALG